MKTLILYGIANCDTVKKARRFLDKQHANYQFYNYKTHCVDNVLLNQFMQHFEWQELINTRGTTWRRLTDEQKAQINSPQTAIALMITNPSIIKRPILTDGQNYLLGFNENNYLNWLKEYHK